MVKHLQPTDSVSSDLLKEVFGTVGSFILVLMHKSLITAFKHALVPSLWAPIHQTNIKNKRHWEASSLRVLTLG